MGCKKEEFGTAKTGETIYKYSLTNADGLIASFINYGAIWTNMWVPDKDGVLGDVILGYDKLEYYESKNPHFGAPIGRYANRIAGGAFTLDGKAYKLNINSDTNSLHSGPDYWHNRVWDVEETESDLGSKLIFSLDSPEGDQGFPGHVKVSVSYTLTSDNMVLIEYQLTSDKTTPCNLTNHCYFNLAGHQNNNILNQEVWIDADTFTPADAHSIPTGEVRSVTGTPMDFTSMKRIGEDIDSDYECIVQGSGYDHNYIINQHNNKMQVIAKARDIESGRIMKVYSDLPGVQFYTGNFLNDEHPGKEGASYPRRSGYCFETQYYPNAINMPQWPAPVVKAGETFNSFTGYRFPINDKEE